MSSFRLELNKCRKEIDLIDNQIIELLKNRFDVVKTVGELKVSHSEPMMQSSRVEEILNKREVLSTSIGLPANLAKDIFKALIEHACTYQTKVMDEIECEDENI
ncbi:chorismate mutase [Enterovibrio coralii]|uniref:chorismate mutase n=1 Tax=Enterovibrio coralii TaxID=294935 RepID=A0A135I523_9GAMM|nr:chorismate mutase [Enterovibrio coralii]KXF80528.1 hypothetical protein ATN88_07530 [Enterovibrio coralii]